MAAHAQRHSSSHYALRLYYVVRLYGLSGFYEFMRNRTHARIASTVMHACVAHAHVHVHVLMQVGIHMYSYSESDMASEEATSDWLLKHVPDGK